MKTIFFLADVRTTKSARDTSGEEIMHIINNIRVISYVKNYSKYLQSSPTLPKFKLLHPPSQSGRKNFHDIIYII